MYDELRDSLLLLPTQSYVIVFYQVAFLRYRKRVLKNKEAMLFFLEIYLRHWEDQWILLLPSYACCPLLVLYKPDIRFQTSSGAMDEGVDRKLRTLRLVLSERNDKLFEEGLEKP